MRVRERASGERERGNAEKKERRRAGGGGERRRSGSAGFAVFTCGGASEESRLNYANASGQKGGRWKGMDFTIKMILSLFYLWIWLRVCTRYVRDRCDFSDVIVIPVSGGWCVSLPLCACPPPSCLLRVILYLSPPPPPSKNDSVSPSSPPPLPVCSSRGCGAFLSVVSAIVVVVSLYFPLSLSPPPLLIYVFYSLF